MGRYGRLGAGPVVENSDHCGPAAAARRVGPSGSGPAALEADRQTPIESLLLFDRCLRKTASARLQLQSTAGKANGVIGSHHADLIH